MKKLTYLFIALTVFASGAFISCDKVKDLLEITLYDVTFDVDLDVSELSTKVDGYAFSGTASFDPSSNADLAPYLATIREVEITELKLTVTSITPATGVSLIDASFSLTDNVNSAEFVYQITTLTPLVVGTEFIINQNTPNFSVVTDIISNMHASTISLSGHVNQPGFVIGFNNLITADITVGVPNDK
ncbi:MAG TPA: hypothetical protein DCG69_01910 [Bacteroidales bacterium]|nr:hypothetical protein [Bacteroidales bacterium]